MNQKHVCDFLLVIFWLIVTDVLSRAVSELSQSIVYVLDTLGFWATLWGLMDNVRAHEKHVVDFLLVLIELFSLGVTAEALRAKIDWKSAISLQRSQLDPKLQVQGTPPIIFAP